MKSNNQGLVGNIIALAVYLEKAKTRTYVGVLIFDKERKIFEFTYLNDYLKQKNIIPVGPEMPLSKITHQSNKLFPSFQDRIPSKENPAYSEYCAAMGIDENESNPIVLLATIGKRGPSSFVYEPIYEDEFTASQMKQFRKDLGLTSREFAACFDLSQVAVTRIENGLSSGREILKRIEIYWRFPEVALFEFKKKSGAIHADKRKKVLKILQARKQKTNGA